VIKQENAIATIYPEWNRDKTRSSDDGAHQEDKAWAGYLSSCELGDPYADDARKDVPKRASKRKRAVVSA